MDSDDTDNGSAALTLGEAVTRYHAARDRWRQVYAAALDMIETVDAEFAAARSGVIWALDRDEFAAAREKFASALSPGGEQEGELDDEARADS